MVKQLHNFTVALFFFFLLLLLDLVPVATLHAQQEPYYKGKTIRFVVGLSAGGFYDLWPRLVARHMGKYIPGNPSFVVQNMPGAGSIVAANYVYGVAKPDGLTLGAPHAGIYSAQLSGQKEVQYDIRKFNWIGSPVKNPLILYMRSDAPYKNIEDLLRANEPAKCGGSGVVSSDYIILAKVLQEALAARGRSPIFTKRTGSPRSGDLGSQIVSDRVLGGDERSLGRAVAPTE